MTLSGIFAYLDGLREEIASLYEKGEYRLAKRKFEELRRESKRYFDWDAPMSKGDCVINKKIREALRENNKISEIEIRGEEPYRYADNRTEEFSRKVIIRYYLRKFETDDSSEYSCAYSLHLDESDANPNPYFPYNSSYRPIQDKNPREVYVEQSTLEEMVKLWKDEGGKIIFMTWGD